MKKFGFIAAAMTMLLSIASVHAAEEGINIYYDAADARNNETTRCVDVVIGGDVANVFQAGEIWFDVDENAYESYEFVPVEGVAADPIKNQFGYFFESEDASIALADGKLGYLKFTVATGAPEFTVALNEDSYVEGKKCEAEVGVNASVTIPAWSTGEPEPPVDTTKKIDATASKASFEAYADSAVDTYTATIESADAEKSVNWVLSNGTAEIKKAASIGDTVVSGDAGIVLGLKVFGDNRAEVTSVVVTVE